MVNAPDVTCLDVDVGKESVPIQFAQCRFPGLAFPMLKYKYIFSIEINIQKQFYETALGNCYSLKLPKC